MEKQLDGTIPSLGTKRSLGFDETYASVGNSTASKNPKIEATKTDTKVQAILDAVINKGIPSNKSLNKPILKITPSFNAPMLKKKKIPSILPCLKKSRNRY